MLNTYLCDILLIGDICAYMNLIRFLAREKDRKIKHKSILFFSGDRCVKRISWSHWFLCLKHICLMLQIKRSYYYVYTQNRKKVCCPLEWGLDVFGGKWKYRILCVLHNNGKLRFGDLKKILPDITDPVLSSMLKELTKSGWLKGFSIMKYLPEWNTLLPNKGIRW